MSDLQYYIDKGRPALDSISKNDKLVYTKAEYLSLLNGAKEYNTIRDEVFEWLAGEPYNEKDQTQLTTDEILGNASECVEYVKNWVEASNETIENTLDLIFRDIDAENGHKVGCFYFEPKD